jgi:hypothetical protein
LGERLLCKQEVIGSIPFTSTDQRTDARDQRTEIGDPEISATANRPLIGGHGIRRRFGFRSGLRGDRAGIAPAPAAAVPGRVLIDR